MVHSMLYCITVDNVDKRIQNQKKIHCTVFYHHHRQFSTDTGPQLKFTLRLKVSALHFSLADFTLLLQWGGLTDLCGWERILPHVNEFAEHAEGATLGDLPQSSNHRQLRVGHPHVGLRSEAWWRLEKDEDETKQCVMHQKMSSQHRLTDT